MTEISILHFSQGSRPLRTPASRPFLSRPVFSRSPTPLSFPPTPADNVDDHRRDSWLTDHTLFPRVLRERLISAKEANSNGSNVRGMEWLYLRGRGSSLCQRCVCLSRAFETSKLEVVVFAVLTEAELIIYILQIPLMLVKYGSSSLLLSWQ